MPFVVLTSHQENPAIINWRSQLIEALRNVSLLERPIQGITLTSAIRSGLRARQRQYQVRDLLLARERATQHLEAQVLERTRDLAQTNAELRKEMRVRESAEEALRQAQKMEALGRLTGGVAHDFNNLLMVISAGLQMLARQSHSDRREQIVESMRHAIQRGAQLTKQLLAFSRKTNLNPQPTDLARQIGAMRELLERSLRGDIRVRFEAGQDLWPVQVDHGELELVILNLAVNARDAMPNGGSIAIRAQNVPALNENGLQGDFVKLTVEDSGSGMTDEVRRRVFEPFFTTKDIGKGSGLGLAQVYGFARQSGGAVNIESEPGVGTIVSLFLPRSVALPPADQRPEAQSRQAERESSTGIVLLVEDDDEVAALVRQMLEELGYTVIRTATGQAALGALADSRQIDVVLSDVMMPGGMNGIELARVIQERRPDLPIVLTSGYPHALGSDVSANTIQILPKPYQLNELEARLRSALEQKPC
jgi:signal transduction histidine kinase/CheY-like chemotaxis protein